MTPILYYLPETCAFGSIVALEWLGKPFRLCRLDETSLKSDAYRKLNPLLQVPTYKSAEGILTESAAILQHVGFQGLSKGIAFKQGTPEYDHLNEMMSFLTTSLHSSIGPIVHPDRVADQERSQEDAVHHAKTVTVPSHFKHIEERLSRHKWLVGDKPTIADAYFYGIARAAKKFINFDKDFPATAKFFDRMKTDPGVVFAHAVEDGKITAPKSASGFAGEVPTNFMGH
jgi:glutathione S-transferase